jgi:hypothetical protein
MLDDEVKQTLLKFVDFLKRQTVLLHIGSDLERKTESCY